jgi:hypothetical protein
MKLDTNKSDALISQLEALISRQPDGLVIPLDGATVLALIDLVRFWRDHAIAARQIIETIKADVRMVQ